MLRPTSGNFLGPKTRAATPAITTSSGTPRPKKALQVRFFLLLLVPVVALFKRSEVVLELVDMKEKEEEEIGSFGISEEDERERVASMAMALRFYSIFWFKLKD